MKLSTQVSNPQTKLPLDKRQIAKSLEKTCNGLFTLDGETQKNIWQLLQIFFVSNFALDYAHKLNQLIDKGAIANSKNSRKEFSRWFNQEVMAMIDRLSEKDLYDDPVTNSTLCEIIAELKSSLDCIEKDDITKEMDYILDLPYRALDIISHSPDIPKLEVQEFKNESQRIRVSSSQGKFKISGTFHTPRIAIQQTT